MTQRQEIGARLQIRGTLIFKDAAGRVLKTVQAEGSKSLADLGLSVEDAKEMIEQHKDGEHDHDCQ